MLYADKTRGIIAASHQGWRGTYNGMAKEMITKMVEEGADINSVTVEIGPAIGLCCYEVKQDVFSQFKEKYEYMGGTVVLKKDGKFFVNLLELNMKLVQEVGVKKENIEFFPFCTKCNEKQFYSYRRDYKDNYDLFARMVQRFSLKKQKARPGQGAGFCAFYCSMKTGKRR